MESVVAKERFIEQLGVHFEQEYQLAPVAARILAILMVAGSEGATFDQLVNTLEASKSTVCTNLNRLNSAGKVSYYTMPGDRKRYFFLSPAYFEQRIDRLITCWRYEMDLYRQLIQIRESEKAPAGDAAAHPVLFPDKALEFFAKAIQSLEQLKQTLFYPGQIKKNNHL